MYKAPRNLDIRKVLITPLYKKIGEQTVFFDLTNVRYEDTFKFIAIYPHEYESFFYNLSESRKDIIFPVGYSKEEEYVINPKENILLLDYIGIVKYKYDKVNYISYNELLYLIEPITQMLKYQKDNKKLKSIQADPNAFITSSVYIKDKIFENRLLEVHKYFVSDINTGMPISYYFISNGIPYMLKDEKKIKRDNNKLLVKRLFKK